MISASDSNHQVASFADSQLKTFSKLDFSHQPFLERVFFLYLGSPSTEDPLRSRRPAGPLLKHRILTHLCRWQEAASRFPNCIQVALDALHGEDSAVARLRQAGVEFVQAIVRYAAVEGLQTYANLLLTGLMKFLSLSDTSEAMRGPAFSAIAQLVHRLPDVFCNDLDMLTGLFEAAEAEKNGIAMDETLSLMINAFRRRDKAKTDDRLFALLERHSSEASPTRLSALKYLNQLFPFSDMRARYLCLLATDDGRLPVREEAQSGLESTSAYPSFDSWVIFLRDRLDVQQAPKPEDGVSGAAATAGQVRGRRLTEMRAIVRFTRRTLAFSAAGEPDAYPEAHSFEAREKLRDFFRHRLDAGVFADYMKLLLDCATQGPIDVPLLQLSVFSLAELLSLDTSAVFHSRAVDLLTPDMAMLKVCSGIVLTWHVLMVRSVVDSAYFAECATRLRQDSERFIARSWKRG